MSAEKKITPSCVSVVIPVYNEEASIGTIVDKLVALPCVLEIIIVDDCSTDQTFRIAQSVAETDDRVRLEKLPKNSGKTEALRVGFSLSRGDIVIVQDADGEYDPSEIPGVIQPILDGHADVVFGSRFLVRHAARVLYFYHFIANKFLTLTSNLLTNLNMTDIETGYKAFRGDIIRNMLIVSEGFGFEVESTAKVAKLGCRIYEVPISYYGRTYQEGKKIGLKDGLIAVWLIIRFNLFCGLASSFREPLASAFQSDHPPTALTTSPCSDREPSLLPDGK
jgi:glycosyltransferase involved in cell wall biosynthesis